MLKFGEFNRTIEAHSECILFLYLLDAQGNPVPNVAMRIWAGPPPTGYPAYFEDHEPDSLTRRTDLNGKFQFIVANPTPVQPLDFYVQAVGGPDQPSSDPIHFSFPPHEARWVIVTLRPEGIKDEQRVQSRGVTDLDLDRGLQMKVAVPPEAGPESSTPAGPPATTNRPSPISTVKAPPRFKLFEHYLLFGPGSQAGTLTNLIIALDYIIRYSPVVGFSADEARNAEHVTLVGDTLALSSSLEQSLLDAGCRVARLTASDSYALENIFKQLIDSGSPYAAQ